MSGISSRLNYDTCAISQQTKTLCAQGGYFLELYSYVNPTLQTAKDVVCLNVEKTVGCLPCDTNKNATLELGPQSFIQRAEIEDGKMAIEWGSQIRNYVLQPYKLVKDVRTGYESTNPEAVLNGQLDGFLKAFLMISGQKESSNEL